MSFHMAVSALCMTVLDRGLEDLRLWCSSLLDANGLGSFFIVSPYAFLAATGSLFDDFAVTVFLICHGRVSFTPYERRDWCHI